MQRWYHQDNYFGRIVQQILLPPMTAYSYDKSSGQCIRKASYLPPRLSMRPLASHKFLCYTVIGAVIANFFGYDVLTFIFAVFLFWLLFVCLKAIRKSSVENTTENTERHTPLYSLDNSF